MSRYFTRTTCKQSLQVRPRAVWADHNQPLIMNVTVCDHDVVGTGLLDQRGDTIMRAPLPIGFGRDEEW